MIVQYYADSLGLPRPGFVDLNQRYVYLFEKWLREKKNQEVFLVDRAKGAATISVLYDIFNQDEEYIKSKKDILIIHEGICDCAPRPVSPFARKIISSLPSFIRIRIVSLIHENRAFLLRNGFVYHHTKKDDYKKILEDWLLKAVDLFEVTYIFNIAPTNSSMEAHSPGFSAGINHYNEIIKNVVDGISNSKIQLIDINKIICESDHIFDDLIIKQDGHHLTHLAHTLYFEQLVKFESKRLGV